jgi:hypothetical protein
MSGFDTARTGLTLTIDGEDHFSAYLEAMGRRMARAEIVPILKEYMKPVVGSEKRILADHTQSGALSMSLKARAGAGDRPEVISVFSAPIATRRQIAAKWSKGRGQQQKWAAQSSDLKRRSAVFYGPFVELGHRIVKRNAQGRLAAVGMAKAVHFARGSLPVLDEQGEAAANAILNFIVGGP